MRKLTHKFVKESFEKEGYILLDKYTNSRIRLKYICKAGHLGSIAWRSWYDGCRCLRCANENKKLSIDFVRASFKADNYTLLSTIYKGAFSKLNYKCDRGHIGSMRWADWGQGTRCAHCSGNAKLNIEFVTSDFKKEGYNLLTDVYTNNRIKLTYECKLGHKHSMEWRHWQEGQRCPTCKDIRFSTERMSSNNPNWRGGISCEPYCQDWTKEYKEFIKERDDNRCLNPHCYKGNSVLSVHHVDYNKKNCGPSNLITLCISCNSRANKDRDWHKDWYQGILSKRHGYKYNNSKIIGSL